MSTLLFQREAVRTTEQGLQQTKKKLVMTTARDCAGSEERKLETTDRRSALLIINVDPHSCAAVKLGHSPQNRH